MRNEMLRVTLPPRLHNLMVRQFAAEMIVTHQYAGRKTGRDGRWYQVDRAVRTMFNTWLKKRMAGIIAQLISEVEHGENMDKAINRNL